MVPENWLHVLDPMRAEVRVRLDVPGGRLQGRLMGPRSRFTSTIEIAYPFRPLGSGATEFAAVVPDPSLWNPVKAFIYEGPIQWTDAGGKTEEAWLWFCFRRLNLGPGGLVLNGKPLQIRGKELLALPEAGLEDELLKWHGQGINALLPTTEADAINELADRLGFLLIEREEAGKNGQDACRCRLNTRFDQRASEGSVNDDRLARRASEGSSCDNRSEGISLPGIVRQADGTFTLA